MSPLRFARQLPFLLLVLIVSSAIASRVPAGWIRDTFKATIVDQQHFTVDAFQEGLERDVGGATWMDDLRVANLSVSGAQILFAVYTPVNNHSLIISRVSQLDNRQQEALGVRDLKLVNGTSTDDAPDESSHTWIVAVVLAGLAVALGSVGFAEHRKRSAVSRRRARAAAENSIQEGMLTDN